jgi:hypothetical protein
MLRRLLELIALRGRREVVDEIELVMLRHEVAGRARPRRPHGSGYKEAL